MHCTLCAFFSRLSKEATSVQMRLVTVILDAAAKLIHTCNGTENEN